MNAKQKEELRRSQQRSQRRVRLVAFIVIAVVVLGTAGYLLKTSFFRAQPAPMAGNVIDIAADMSGFDKREISVKLNQPVTVRLTSLDNSAHTDGGGKHQWAIDELGVDVVARPLSSNLVTFTPAKPGRYDFYCDICCGGRANPTMHGTLVVEA